jgi:polyribonucleotide nucleotidyltransferase
MNAALPRRATSCRSHAPRIITVQIKPDKIRDIIGPGGKTIRALTEQTGAHIDVSDTGVCRSRRRTRAASSRPRR